MFFYKKTYDIDELALYNMHTHSTFSTCAKPEMTAVAMVKEAQRAGLKMLAITDHNYKKKKNALIAQRLELKKQLKNLETNVTVLIGGELSAYGVGKFADSIKCDKAMDFRLYTTNHFHQEYWKQPKDKTPRGYAKHMLAICESVIESGRADCFAHPFMANYIDAFDNKKLVTRAYKDEELYEIMKKGYEKEIAWELNLPAIMSDPEFHHRYFQIGKEAGVFFTLGTDAHVLKKIDSTAYADDLKRILY